MADISRSRDYQTEQTEFGTMPMWDLDDLFPGPQSPEFKAALDGAATEAQSFEADNKGKLADKAAAGELGDGLPQQGMLLGGVEELLVVALRHRPIRREFHRFGGNGREFAFGLRGGLRRNRCECLRACRRRARWST